MIPVNCGPPRARARTHSHTRTYARTHVRAHIKRREKKGRDTSPGPKGLLTYPPDSDPQPSVPEKNPVIISLGTLLPMRNSAPKQTILPSLGVFQFSELC